MPRCIPGIDTVLSNVRYPVLAVCLCLGITLGCGLRDEGTTLPGSGPIESLHVSDGGITVNGKKGEPLHRFFDMELFEGAKPGLRFEDAHDAFGTPDNVVIDREVQRRCEEYWRLRATIEVCFQEVHEGLSWSLSVVPVNAKVPDLFPTAISQHFKPGMSNIIIDAPNSSYRVNELIVVLSGEQVKSVWWRRW